jgi:hypothetical protein
MLLEISVAVAAKEIKAWAPVITLTVAEMVAQPVAGDKKVE